MTGLSGMFVATLTLLCLKGMSFFSHPIFVRNHNYNKIVKSDWLSTALISALIGQFNWTVRAITRALKWLIFFTASKTKFRISCVLILKIAYYITNFVKVMINW